MQWSQDQEKRKALRDASRAQSRFEQTDVLRRTAMRKAQQEGATYQEIADAMGVPHQTVKNLIHS